MSTSTPAEPDTIAAPSVGEAPLTHAELHLAACALAPGELICTNADVWRRNGVDEVSWSIWSSRLGEHFSGRTPEGALAAFRDALSSTSIEQLGDVAAGLDVVP